MNPSRPCRNGPGAGAFTLIEIMMVVAILGLTLAMGLPSFIRVLRREGMRKAEYEILDGCREARRAAIMGNKVAVLVIHPMDHTLDVPGASEAAQIPGDVNIDILGVNFIQLEHAPEADVHFFPNGTSDEFTILMHSSGGAYEKISLDTVTALPDIQDIQ